MKGLLKEYLDKNMQNKNYKPRAGTDQWLNRKVRAIYDILADLYGSENLVLKASKLGALKLLKSKTLPERVLGLQKLVWEDPTMEKPPVKGDISSILGELEEELADHLARRGVEEQLERRVSEKMQKRHQEYVQEIKLELIKEKSDVENAQTLKKLAVLEKLSQKNLSLTVAEILRPQKLEELTGQDPALAALLSKIASPFPQHALLFGPPGVGKTSAARLVLEEAKKLAAAPFGSEAPFVEVNGAVLRWDPREATNPLLGSVHDPIYQGARKELAESGIPEPKPGLVTDAHGGILFIDEIGDMDPLLLIKLLKVLEDKKVHFDSSYYDPHDKKIPKYIKKLFEEGAPADFVLIGATTRDPQELNPALRSRCAEVFFNPLTPQDITQICRTAAAKLEVFLEAQALKIISEYTIDGRKATSILADAHNLALYRREKQTKTKRTSILVDDINQVIQHSRLSPQVTVRASSQKLTGRALGLGVDRFIGSVLEIEAACFPASRPGKGTLRFNETAGTMARDSVFNAASVIRRLAGLELNDYDVHVNVVGGGRIDGPSAGAAICLALLSTLQDRPLRQDLAVTGEISLRGEIKPVGGLWEKIYGARQAGIKQVLVSRENSRDIPADLKGIKVVPVKDMEEVIKLAFK